MAAKALADLQRGDPAAAEVAASAAIAANPRSGEAHYLLGNARLFLGRNDEAATSFRRAIELEPKLAEAHNNLGIVLERSGRLAEAAQCYRDAVALRSDYAEAHNNLGNACAAFGRAEEAVAAFRAAVTARSVYPEAWYNLGNALAGFEQGEAAATAYRQALAQRPRFVEALNNLSVVLVKLGRPVEAEAVSRQAIAIEPRLPASHYNLGDALREGGRAQDAIAAYRQALALRPGDADARIAIGNILLSQGQAAEAEILFHEAQRLRPLTRRPAAKAKPDFSALLLIAPGAANTPVDYLTGDAPYDGHVVALMPGVEYDLELLRAKGDVVINLVSDVDRDGGILPLATDLIARIGRPTVNHPDRIRSTGRDAIAARLAGIAGCRVPRTERLTAASLAGAVGAASLTGFPLPLLIRPGGAHGGAELEKIDAAEAVAAFASRHPAPVYYATEYVDFGSADGYFRKYRLIFVDGEIFPYHLAIDSQWKVHHFRTDMANQEWMRAEEEAFLRDPGRIFDAERMAALRATQAEIGLDYFGIDCAIDRQGLVVVFEVNATMLVHGETGVFAYKQPYIARIKRAFEAMLAKRVHAAA